MTTNIIIIICFAIAIAAGFYYLRGDKTKKRPTPSIAYPVLMGILDEVIKTEISERQKDYLLRNVRIIYDFRQDQILMVQNILMSLSEDFLDDLYYYHPRKYITLYVSKSCKDFLVMYTQENKIKTK